MTVDESKALKKGTRVYWRGNAADSGIFVTEVFPRDKMIVGIMGVMEVDVVVKQLTANWMVGNLIM